MRQPQESVIGLFADDVIIIGSVCADWPAPFNLTMGILVRTNLDEMALNVSGGFVKLIEKDVSGQRLCSALSRITVCFT